MRRFSLSIFFLFLESCSNSGKIPLVTIWENEHVSQEENNRSIASFTNFECMKDLYSVENLKKEVLHLEKKFSKVQKVQGQWKHIDLSTLPVPQANFLKTYGLELGDLTGTKIIDYSSCKDLPCIFNKIYNKDDDVAGYVHYLWYLKFGNMLSADNRVPDQKSSSAGVYNDKLIPFENYLYKDQELYGFWRLSHMLNSSHLYLRRLREIQRIPQGEKFEDPAFARACGLAYSRGQIELQDACLRFRSLDLDSGSFYDSVVHELTHQIDFELGSFSSLRYRSHEKDYLDLAGMYIYEYVNNLGKLTREWKLKPETSLVTSYAGTSPQENFAESIALFRVEGESTQAKITQKHSEFISREFYQNLAFDNTSMIKNWISSKSLDLEKIALDEVTNCLTNKSDMSDDHLSCVSEKEKNISSIFKNDFKVGHPEGCRIFKSEQAQMIWDSFLGDYLSDKFDSFLRLYEKNPSELVNYQKYFKKIVSSDVARDAFFACFEGKDPEECFLREVQVNFQNKMDKIVFSTEDNSFFLNTYLTYHTFKKTKNDLERLYQSLILSRMDLIRTNSLSLWKSCTRLGVNDKNPPKIGQFNISNGYLISSIHNCINLGLKSSVLNLIEELSVSGHYVTFEKEKKIMEPFILPEFLKVLIQTYENEKYREKASVEKLINNDNGLMRGKILSIFDWKKISKEPEEVMTKCKNLVYENIPFPLIYHLPSELYSDFAQDKVCKNLSDDVK